MVGDGDVLPVVLSNGGDNYDWDCDDIAGSLQEELLKLPNTEGLSQILIRNIGSDV